MNIIITGTSRGIGLALVNHFANTQHQVIAISRKPTNYSVKATNIICVEADITLESGLNKITETINNHWKKVDVLINNAGRLLNKPFKDTSYQEFLDVYNVNVFAVAMLTKFVLPFMNSGAHVLSVSSMGGIQGSAKFPGLAAYSSSKGAVITLMELLAEEYKEQQISFNTLALGAVQTEMLEEAFPGYQAPVTPEQMANYIAQFSLTGNVLYNGKVLQVANSTP